MGLNRIDAILNKFKKGEPLTASEEELVYQKGTVEQVNLVFSGYPI